MAETKKVSSEDLAALGTGKIEDPQSHREWEFQKNRGIPAEAEEVEKY